MRILSRGFPRCFLAFLAALLLASCGGGGGGEGGGGGGSGEGVGPAPFSDTAAAYWVAGTGDRWVYQRVDRRPGADPAPILKTVVDMGEQVVGGVATRRFEHSWSLFGNEPETEFRYFDGRAIMNIADLTGVLDFSGPAAYAEVPAPLVDGGVAQVLDRSQPLDLDGDGVMDTLRVVAHSTTTRVASLSVPAGDFTNLLQVRLVITGTATIAATGTSASVSSTLTTWYAPGVGIVRRVYEDPEQSAPANTVTEELVGLAAGGKRAGTLPGVMLLDDIGAGTSSDTPAAQDIAIGTDRMLVVATRDNTVQAALRTLDGSLVWGGAVLQAPAGSVFGTVSASFDGQDFRIVATHRRPFDSPAVTTMVAQRLSTAGVLRDALAGSALDTGIADNTQTIGAIRTAARQGRLLVTWGRFEATGYVLEGRLFGASNLPEAGGFTLGAGLPAAAGVRDDQFIVLPAEASPLAVTLRAWAIDAATGFPVSGPGTVVDQRVLVRSGLRLQAVGTEIWMSYSSGNSGLPSPPSVTVARLGRDGALLDGSVAQPGTLLVQPNEQAGSSVAVGVGVGGARNVLAWTQGWNKLRATIFDAPSLAGSAALPAESSALVVGDPTGAIGPSRQPLWAGAVGNGLMVTWLDNEQSAATPSDRIMGTLVLPRWVGP